MSVLNLFILVVNVADLGGPNVSWGGEARFITFKMLIFYPFVDLVESADVINTTWGAPTERWGGGARFL